MSRAPRALIVYASTSGSTAEVVRLLSRALPAMETTRLDLGTEMPDHANCHLTHFDLLLAGTPTYGRGDWHSAWERRQVALLPAFRTAHCVMLFALGDSRSHHVTFAGGLAALVRLSRAAGANAIGATIPEDDAQAASPAIEAGHLPGLALEYRRRRHAVAARIEQWLSPLPLKWRRA